MAQINEIKIKALLRDKGGLADGSRKIVIETQEIEPEMAAIIPKLHNKFGWFYFGESGELPDLPEIKAEFDDQKTPSQRLRNTLYVFWDQQTNKTKTFQQFYAEQMEKIITWFKEKLT